MREIRWGEYNLRGFRKLSLAWWTFEDHEQQIGEKKAIEIIIIHAQFYAFSDSACKDLVHLQGECRWVKCKSLPVPFNAATEFSHKSFSTFAG